MKCPQPVKYSLCLLLILAIRLNITAQEKVINIEKIIFTKTIGTQGVTSVTLLLKVEGTDRLKLNMKTSDKTAVEVPLSDFDYEVVAGLLAEQLRKWYTAFAGQNIDGIFDINALVKIKELVNDGFIARAAYNSGPRNPQQSIFTFFDSIPFYKAILRSHGPAGKPADQVQPSFIRSSDLDSILKRIDMRLSKDSGNALLRNQVTDVRTLLQENRQLSANVKVAEDRKQSNTFALEKARILNAGDTATINPLVRQIARDDSISRVGALLQGLNNQRIEQLKTKLGASAPPPPQLDSFYTRKYLNFEYGRMYIDSTEIVIRDGFVRYIKLVLNDTALVYTNDGTVKKGLKEIGIRKEQFYNVSIDLRTIIFNSYNLQKVLNFKMRYEPGSDIYCFYLPNLFSYSPPNDPNLVDNFVPLTSRLIFTSGKKVISVPETDINRILTLNIFSDIVGINEDKPNGLLQAEAKFFGNLARNSMPRKAHRGTLNVVSYFEAHLLLSKLENKEKYLELNPQISPTDTTYYIHTFNLLQYQNLSMSVKLNLLRYADATHEGHLNAGVGVLRTGVRDSLKQVLRAEETAVIPHNFNIWSLQYYLQVMYRLKAISRVGMDVTVNITRVSLLDKQIQQSAGNYDRFNSRNNTYEKRQALQDLMFNPVLQAYYYASSDEGQRIYARLGFNVSTTNRGNNFPTIQVGYSADINKFLQFK